MRTNAAIYGHVLLRIHVVRGQRSVRIALSTGLPLDPLGEDHSGSPQQRIEAICEGGSVHRDETFRGALQTRWRTESP